MSQLLPLLIALPLAAALLMLPAGRFRKLPPALSLLVALSLLAVTVALYFFRQFNFVLIYNVNLAPLPGGGSLVLDGLSHLLLLTVKLIACLVIAYAIPYMERYTGLAKFYALYMLMLAGMIGVVLAGDLFSLFIFLEVAAIAT
jgi:multicomponent Na+:H+ antiporter subunit D